MSFSIHENQFCINEEIWGILNTNSLKIITMATFVGDAHLSSHKKVFVVFHYFQENLFIHFLF